MRFAISLAAKSKFPLSEFSAAGGLQHCDPSGRFCLPPTGTKQGGASPLRQGDQGRPGGCACDPQCPVDNRGARSRTGSLQVLVPPRQGVPLVDQEPQILQLQTVNIRAEIHDLADLPLAGSGPLQGPVVLRDRQVVDGPESTSFLVIGLAWVDRI